jgi:hypothetical protein
MANRAELLRQHAVKLKKLLAKHKAGKEFSDEDMTFLGESHGESPIGGATLVYDSMASAAAGLDVPLGELKKLKKELGPKAGFRGSRVYAVELLPHLRSREGPAGLAPGTETKEQLECRFLRIRIERQQFAFDAERGQFLEKAELEAWLCDRIMQIRTVLATEFKNELPKFEGLRGDEMYARAEPFITKICELLRLPTAKDAKDANGPVQDGTAVDGATALP